jgi:hypothetical protein
MNALMGIAGGNTWFNIANAHAAVGIAGEPRGLTLHAVEQATVATSASAHKVSNRIGDQAAVSAGQRGCWFQDPTYIVKQAGGRVVWKEGRAEVFSRPSRRLPLLIDSMGYRREITGAAPRWARNEGVYHEMIELIDPDGYAAWDYPLEGPEHKARTVQALRRLMATFPRDVGAGGRMWPVFSVRWTWDDRAVPSFNSLPTWRSRPLQTLIPLNKTQEHYSEAHREAWARAAVANALLLASDADFRWMCETFGRVMIGGLVRGPCHRLARHIFAAVLCQLFPACQFWLLGQANFAVVNGLAVSGLLDRVWVDGTWYLHDARADTFAILDRGLITMNQIRQDRKQSAQTFFTLGELMAANLRSLMAAYLKGHEWWPVQTSLPLDWRDAELLRELQGHFRAAQLELGLFPSQGKEAA